MRESRPLPFLPICLLALATVSTAYGALTAGANSTLSSPPGTGSTCCTASDHTITIVARDATGAAQSTGGDLFAVDVFTAASVATCDTNLATPRCAVGCAPRRSPNTASASCLSSTLPSSPAVYYTPARITDNSDGTYSAVYAVEQKGLYDISVAQLTQGGLLGSYYDNIWFIAPAAFSQVDATLNFNWQLGLITTYGADYVSVRWSGKLRPDYTESFTIFAQADDGVRVWIDRQLVIDSWDRCCNESWATVSLVQDHMHDILVDYLEVRGNASMVLSWASASVYKRVIPATSLYYRTPIAGSPWTDVSISAGDPPSAATSTVQGTGVTASIPGAVGSVAAFTVTLRDAFSNVQDVVSPTYPPVLAISPSGPVIQNSIVYVANGTYNGSYSLSAPGNYTLHVTVNGVDVVGSPVNIIVASGPTSGPNCTAYGGGLYYAQAGVTATFTVQARDYFTNNRTLGGDTVAATVNTPGGTVPAVVTDLLTGQYQVSYTVSSVGSCSVAVTVGGQPISGSPFSALVVATGPVNARTSTASGGGLSSATSAVAASFTITARDKFGNARTSGGSSFAASLTGPATVSVTVTDNSDGTYTCGYTATQAGTYSLAVTLGGVHIASSPFTVAVAIASTSATNSLTSGAGLSSARSGSTAYFNITSRDASSNVVTTGTDPWVVALSCGSVSGTVAWLASASLYTVSYVPTVSGSCSLSVRLGAGGTHATGSPFTVAVAYDVMSAATSTIAGAGLTAATAGSLASFTITAKDAASNSHTVGGGRVSVNMTSAAGVSVPVTVTDLNTGQYTASFTATNATSYSTTVRISNAGGLIGTYYSDTAMTVSVSSQKDAVISFSWGSLPPVTGVPATYYSAVWTGMIRAVYSETYTFFLSYAASSVAKLFIGGTLLIDSGSVSSGDSESYGSALMTAGALVPIRVEFSHNIGASSLALAWQSPSTPRALVPSSALFDNAASASSPYTTAVAPAATSATTSSAYTTLPTVVPRGLTGLSSSVASTATAAIAMWLTVQPRDAYGNLQTAAVVTTNIASFTSSIVQIDNPGVVTTATVSDNGDGTVAVSVTPRIAGVNQLSVKIGGSHILGSPFTVQVAPGVALAAACTAVGTLTPQVAGVPASFIIQANDGSATANNLLSGGLTFTAVLSPNFAGPSTVTAAVVDLANGQYSVSYTLTAAGSWTLTVQLAGTDIASSPFTITVNPASASASTTTASSTPTLVTSSFTVTTSDRYSNALSAGGSDFVVTLTNIAGPSARGTVTDSGNGQYSIAYDVSSIGAGTYLADVLLCSDTNGAVNGLTGAYYNNAYLQGVPALRRVDSAINFNWGTGLITPTAANYVSVSWTGFIKPSVSGSVTVWVDADDGVRLYINDVLLIDQWTAVGAGVYWSAYSFPTANLLYSLRLDYRQLTGSASATLSWDVGAGKVTVPSSRLFATGEAVLGSPFTWALS